MRTYRSVALGIVGGLVAGIALTPLDSGAKDDGGLQRLLDKAAIENVLVRYTHALDTLDAEKYASVFAEDAVFDMGRETRTGRAQIKDIITGLKKSRDERQAAGTATPSLMHHVMTNATLEIVSDREAHHYAYWMTILANAEGTHTVASMGHYEDVLMKHDDAWLIQSRKLLR